MAWNTAIPAEKEASQECAAQDGHEVTDVEGHDSQHAKIKVSFSVICEYCKEKLTGDIQCRQLQCPKPLGADQR